MNSSNATSRTPRRVLLQWVARGSGRSSWAGFAVGSTLVVLMALLLGSSTAFVAQWLEPVRAEIPSWKSTVLGLSDSDAEIWSLDVDPQVLRAAELLIPDGSELASDDRWWFPAQVTAEGRRYAVRAQLLNAGDRERGVRVRFPDRAQPDGVERIEFVSADMQRHGLEWLARETARDVGLIAAPSGFSRLSINGGEPQIVFWRESASPSMLQRLGYPKSEIFRANAATLRGPGAALLPAQYASSLDASPRRAHAASLRRLIALVARVDGPAPQDAVGFGSLAFEEELARVVDIDKLLAWDALTQLFGAPDTQSIPSDWYFNPITGLLEPVLSSLESRGVGSSEAGLAAQAVVARPGRRAQRDALLRDWTGVTRSLLLADADRRLGAIAARVAASSSWHARTRDMAALAQLRRGAREDVQTSTAALRTRLAGVATSTATDLSIASDSDSDEATRRAAQASARDWVRESGLSFRIDGEWLVLPAGPHRVTRTLVLPDSHRLRIEPGAELLMAPKASLIAFRGVEAIGTRRAPISIRPLDADEPWGAIGIARAPETSEFAYVRIVGGSDAKFEGIEFSGQLSLNSSDVVIRDTDLVDGHGDDSVSVKRGFFHVSRSRFIDNRSDGFDAEWSTGSIEESLFASNGDDGLDLGTSEVRVHRTWFRRMGDKAISAGERSRVSVSDSQLVDSQIAIASKEDSRVEVRGSEFRRNEIGISLYRDSAVFGSGYGVVSGGLFSENLRDFAVEAGSGLTLNGVERRTADAAGIVVGLRSIASPALSGSALQ